MKRRQTRDKLTIHTAALTTANTARCTQTGETIKVTLEGHKYLKDKRINIQQPESCGGDLYRCGL